MTSPPVTSDQSQNWLEDNVKIAGDKTVGEWKGLFPSLVEQPTIDKRAWNDAINFFAERIELRYLSPIRALINDGCQAGEGFAIATLQCCLLEFLQAFVDGKIYTGNDVVGESEYNRSEEMFVRMLTKPPFNVTNKGAIRFYKDVRCGLVHEARVKGTWKIRADDVAKVGIDARERVVQRNALQKEIVMWIDKYKKDLLSQRELRKNFIRKFNGLCST